MEWSRQIRSSNLAGHLLCSIRNPFSEKTLSAKRFPTAFPRSTKDITEPRGPEKTSFLVIG